MLWDQKSTIRKKCKKKNKKSKHVEAKIYATKQLMDHWRNQRRHQKMPGNKLK